MGGDESKCVDENATEESDGLTKFAEPSLVRAARDVSSNLSAGRFPSVHLQATLDVKLSETSSTWRMSKKSSFDQKPLICCFLVRSGHDMRR